MNNIANREDLKQLFEQYPDEFVLAVYDNKNNFRVAKSPTGALLKFGYNYYGEFVGKKIIYVHKNDLTDNIVKVNTPKITKDASVVNDKNAEHIELQSVNDDIEIDIVDIEATETVKPKRKRKTKE